MFRDFNGPTKSITIVMQIMAQVNSYNDDWLYFIWGRSCGDGWRRTYTTWRSQSEAPSETLQNYLALRFNGPAMMDHFQTEAEGSESRAEDSASPPIRTVRARPGLGT